LPIPPTKNPAPSQLSPPGAGQTSRVATPIGRLDKHGKHALRRWALDLRQTLSCPL